MTHQHTSCLLPVSPVQAIRRSCSEEHLPASNKAENSFPRLRSRSLSTATRLIPRFTKLGREVKIRFETTDQRESRRTEKNFEEEEIDHEGRSCTRREGDRQQVEITSKSFLNNRVDSKSLVKIKMSLVQADPPAGLVSDLKEARDVIKKLNISLQNEKKISAAKDTTIENLRHEIDFLDVELGDKRKESDKYIEEMRKLRSKTTSLETENKILERQVKMMNESNKRLHNELHELRDKLRVQETKVGELRVQKSEAFRKYAHLLQTSVDKGTRLRYFLQQLQNEILAQSVTVKKFQIQREAIENLMQEDSEEDLQFKKYGLISPRKIRRSSYSLSEKEKESLRRDLEGALVGRHNKLPEKSLQLEKVTTAAERIVTEGLKTRLGRDSEESSHMSKLMQEAKHQIKSLDRIESSRVETSKRLQDKVGTQLEALEVELKDLSDELKMAQITKREDEEKLRSITKFSTADAKIESVSLARRASQVEKLDLESAIHTMERKSEDSTIPTSPRELEILSMKRKMADMLEEKLALSDELIESRTNLSNLETLLQSRNLENQKMEKELADKEKMISSTEESLREAQNETLSLKEELRTAKAVATREREEGLQSNGKVRDRAHRVELNFTPSSQPALEQKVETLKEELSTVRRNSITQLNKAIPAFNKVDKGVQVGDETNKVEKARRENPRVLRRTMSMDMISSGHVKGQRRVSRAELTLVKRADKEVQVEICDYSGFGKIKETFEREDLRDKLRQENQHLKAVLEQQDRDIDNLKDELKQLQENKLDSSSNSPFNYPKRTSELWTALEEAKKDKAQGERRNRELRDELEKREQEIEILIKSLKQQGQELNLLSTPTENETPRKMVANYKRSQNGKENMVVENARLSREIVNADEGSLIDHAFVYDSEDGRRVLAVQRLEDISKSEENATLLESVTDSNRKELANSQEQCRELETKLYRKDEDLRKAERDIELHKIKLSEMQALLEKMSKDKENIQKDANEYKDQMTALKILLEETRKERFKTQEEFKRCKLQITELKETLDRTIATNENNEEYKYQISELKSLLDKTTGENQRIARELESRDSQIEDLKTALKDMSKEHRNAEEEIERRKSEIFELKLSVDETSQEKHKANDVSERLKSQIADLQTSLEGSKKALSGTATEMELYKSKISELKIQLDKTKEQYLEATKEIQRCKSQISILEASLDTMKQDKVSAEEEIKKNQNEISNLQALLEERRKENEKTSENVKRYKSQVEEIEKYKSEISDLKCSLDISEKDGANLTKEHELFKFEISDLQGLLEEERTEHRAAKEKIEKLKSKTSDLKSSLQKAQEENDIAANDIQRYKSQIVDLTASLEKGRRDNINAEKKMMDEYEFEISELRNSVRKAEEKSQDAINDTERCKAQISVWEELLEKVESGKKQGSLEKIQMYESEISDLKRSLVEKQEEIKKAADDNEVFKAQISDLETGLDEAKKESNKHETEISKLKTEVNKLEETVQGFKIKEAEIRLEKERLKNNNSQLKITVDNLKNQLVGADNKVKDLEIQGDEDKWTISRLMEEKLGAERLQEQIKMLETEVSVRDKDLEQKAEEGIRRDGRIVQISQEKEKLEKMIQDVLTVKQYDSPFDITDGEMVVKAQAQSVRGSPNEALGDESMEELQNGLDEFKKQLTTLQVELKEIQREKVDLEETVEQLRNVKSIQEKELQLLRQQAQQVESGVMDTERSLEVNAELMTEKEKELRELVNEKVVKTSQIESLEESLSSTLQEREATLAAKEEAIEWLQEENQRLEAEVSQLKMDIQQQMLDWQQKAKMEDEYKDLTGKLKETELKFLLTKEEKDKVEKDLRNATERTITLQKSLSDAQATIKGKEEKIKQLTAENFDMRAMIKEKDESLKREEKLRMDNMKGLDTLKIKMDKMETDDKRQRERLFSLKSACSEANEAYEIVKKQNHEMKREIEEVRKRLSERDCALKASEKEKGEMEEQILNASRTIDDLRKSSSFRMEESVSPDSALGLSLSTPFEFSSGPNSPNSVASDNAFSGDGFGGHETGLLCKMPTMIENFRAVVRENEAMRGKLYDHTVRREKLESEMKHLAELNEMLKNDVAVKEKSVFSLEDKLKVVEHELRDAKNKVVELERSFAIVSSQADLLKSTLDNRGKDFADLQEKIELHEEREKTLELYSKSVAEKFEHEASEKKKFEDLSRQLLEESTVQKNILQSIEKKVSSSPGNRNESYFSAPGSVPIATVEDKVDVLLKNKEELEDVVSNLQAEVADLQLANGDLQKDLTQYLESERMRQELEGELKATRVRDELASAKVVKLEEQKEALQNENKRLEQAIVDMKKKGEDAEFKAEVMKRTVATLEKSNENFQNESENLKNDLRKADEETAKLLNELKSFQAKMSEIEITNDAFQVENEKLRSDITALSEAKCEVELMISEAERQNKKLKESAEKERENRGIAEAQKNEALNNSEALRNELKKAKDRIAGMEEKHKEAEISVEELQRSSFDSTSENRRLADELQLARKDLSEMEDRYKNSVQEEENLQQKLNLANLEMAKLKTTHKGSLKRNDAMEKSLFESKGKNEELEITLEKTRLEKANVLRDVSQKEEVIQALEAKIHEVEEERLSLTNDLYVATRKVLAQQQNAETLMNDMNLVNREMKGAIKNTLSKDGRNTEEEMASPRDGDGAVSDNEVVMQNLRQSIRATERNLDFYRSEAKVPESDTKSCHRDVEFINKEFMLLRNQLSTFATTSQKLCEEIKKLKEDLAQKEALLEEAKEQHNNVKDENLESRESIIQLQKKSAELESLFGEYENKAEQQHAELVRANQQISTLDSSLMRAEQKKAAHEKELLVAHEKISHLEAGLRAMKDENRTDKKRIATLETEFTEKQALSRELDKTEATLRDLKARFDDMLKEKEEAKAELYGIREELRQEHVELKNTRKDVENLKKQMNSEKDTRQKVELDLNENAAACKTYKTNLQELERSFARLHEENSDLEEKVSILEAAGNALRKETELQAIEMKRLEEELADSKEQYTILSKNHESSEKERKRLTTEMIDADEKIAKLQGTCEELLKEKELSSGKVLSLNEALEVIIASNEETAANLKRDILTAKKELSVTKSALERRQKQVEELQEELKNDEQKIKLLEEKKQEVFQKYWATQNDLTEAEGTIHNLRSENKELQDQNASNAQRIQQLQDTLHSERETNEKEVAAWSDQMNKLKNLHQKVMEERGNFKKDLDQVQGSLEKTESELKQTSKALSEKEKTFNEDVTKRDQSLEELTLQNAILNKQLEKTKDTLAKTSVENDDLKERLEITSEKVEWLEKELQERNAEIEDLLAEAQAKLNVVRKMKATNSGEHFVEFLSPVLMVHEDGDGTDAVDARPVTPRETSMKDVVTSFHQVCLTSFDDNRGLQQELASKSDQLSRLEDNLQQEKNSASEMKRYVHDLEKKKAKLEDEVKRLRRRLESLKLKTVEMEKEKDNEITEAKGEKILREKDLWNTKEELEELKAKLKIAKEEKERYAKDLETSRKQIVDAKSDIKGSQYQLDALQENILQLKRRTFELEANERASQQLIQDNEKELGDKQSKIGELEKLYDNASKMKAALFAKLGRAEEQIVKSEKECQDKIKEKTTLEGKIAALEDNLADKSSTLTKTEDDLNDSLEKCEELEIQRGSLQATNEILKHQLEGTKQDCSQLKALLEKEKELSNALSTQLDAVKNEKENLDRDLKAALEQKEHIEELMNKSEENLNIAEEKAGNSFHETENLKRQMVKIQSGACADSARKQIEIGKLKAEAESLRQELHEKEKEHKESLTKFKVTEKENEFLKKDLAHKHDRESELKIDLTTTNSKLQSYVIERECWEREVKSVLSEIEHQKNVSQSKEEKMERLRRRYENDNKLLGERVEALEREVRIIQEAGEQQRHADEITAKLALETKDMEIDNLKLRLQASRMHTSEKSDVLDVMKEQLDERTREMANLMEQMRMLKESYHLELGSLHAELKCAQMENMLHKRGELGGSFSGARQETELLEAIKQSRKESERLRSLLTNKMREMKSLRKHILSERLAGARKPGYTTY